MRKSPDESDCGRMLSGDFTVYKVFFIHLHQKIVLTEG